MIFEHKIAEYLLQNKAILLQPTNPFTWASGWKSPIYCDNRITLSIPNVRTLIKSAFIEYIQQNFPSVEVIAGVATGGIAQAALVAEHFDLPLVYVRPSAKAHGTGKLVEGEFEKGKKVVIIEDLVSTGKSSLSAVEALRSEGADILGMLAVFTYGFPVSLEKFAENDCKLVTLTDYKTLLEVALKTNYITRDQLTVLNAWREEPEKWNP